MKSLCTNKEAILVDKLIELHEKESDKKRLKKIIKVLDYIQYKIAKREERIIKNESTRFDKLNGFTRENFSWLNHEIMFD